MGFKQLSQSGVTDSPTSSDKQYIAKYLADKMARKLYLQRSDSQVTNSPKYWTNKDSGRTDSQTANTSKRWRESDKKDEAESTVNETMKLDRSTTSIAENRDGQTASSSKYWTNKDSGTANTSEHWKESDSKDKPESTVNESMEFDKYSMSKTSIGEKRDGETANSSKYWTNAQPPRISESGLRRKLSTTSLPEEEKDGSNIDVDAKGMNKKKAQFRTEQSLLTFHPHKNDSVSEILQQLDDVSDSIRFESDARTVSSIESIRTDETQKLILKKLSKILRLLEKKDQT
ncbi:uncharacterized protein DDB_G0286299-like [Pieris napi]|uniref:uncharacterized protein DDB_G0286299-like n=1 Tax=Pieris napi TaxID=78633 RepID=UPI001FB8D22E|nr:uncharacterized protein DDB_G0286299-like [Pieris napi]